MQQELELQVNTNRAIAEACVQALAQLGPVPGSRARLAAWENLARDSVPRSALPTSAELRLFWEKFLLVNWQGLAGLRAAIQGLTEGTASCYLGELAAELTRLSEQDMSRGAARRWTGSWLTAAPQSSREVLLVLDHREAGLRRCLQGLPFVACEELPLGDIAFRLQGSTRRLFERKRADDCLQGIYSGRFQAQREALADWVRQEPVQRSGCVGYIFESPGWLLQAETNAQSPLLLGLKRAQVVCNGGSEPDAAALALLRSTECSTQIRYGFQSFNTAHILHTAVLILNLFRAWEATTDTATGEQRATTGDREKLQAAVVHERARQGRRTYRAGSDLSLGQAERLGCYAAIRGVSPAVARALCARYPTVAKLVKRCLDLGGVSCRQDRI